MYVCLTDGRVRSKSKSIKRHSGIISEGTDSSSLAKLPPGDSDEEAELVKLISAKTSSGSESSPTGREHPFSPMVNRDMLYSLVRCAFRQTEEQQINFESSLRREYGRRSKGEVRREGPNKARSVWIWLLCVYVDFGKGVGRTVTGAG